MSLPLPESVTSWPDVPRRRFCLLVFLLQCHLPWSGFENMFLTNPNCAMFYKRSWKLSRCSTCRTTWEASTDRRGLRRQRIQGHMVSELVPEQKRDITSNQERSGASSVHRSSDLSSSALLPLQLPAGAAAKAAGVLRPSPSTLVVTRSSVPGCLLWPCLAQAVAVIWGVSKWLWYLFLLFSL